MHTYMIEVSVDKPNAEIYGLDWIENTFLYLTARHRIRA